MNNKVKKSIEPKTTDKVFERFWIIAAAITFVSFSVLSFEIVLTRIFSVMLSHDYVFAILSFAIFGLGLGGIIYHKWYKKYVSAHLGEIAALYSLLIILSVLLIIKLPIFNNPRLVDIRLWIYIFLATVTFISAGLILSAVFQRFPERISVLYGFDLTGAALGVVGAILLLNNFNGITAVFIIAGVSLVGTVLINVFEKRFSTISFVLTGGLVLMIFWAFVNTSLTNVPIAMDPNKDMYRMLNHPLERAKIIESRWNAFGRTDLVKSEITKNEMVLFVDGAAGSPMYNFNALLKSKEATSQLMHHFGESFPFMFLEDNQKDSALIIGPGGGRDVIIALLSGVKSITAVEVNPAMVEIVKEYEDFNGGIYTKIPNVKVVIQEGRNYLRTSKEKYDLIMLALPVIKSSRSIEGFALTENYLFTVEAFDDYFDHLTPEGRLIIVAHGDVEIYRLLNLYLEMNKRKGLPVTEAMKHIYTLASPMMPTIVFQKQPFDSAGAKLRHELLHKLGYDKGNYYVPLVNQMILKSSDPSGIENEWFMFDQMLINLSRGALTTEELIKSSVFDISVVTDDRPFFYDFKKGLPSTLTSIFLFVLFAMGVVLIPVLFTKNSQQNSRSFFKDVASIKQLKIFMLIFSLLGAGFMLIEIAFFQKITLYFSHPVYALTVILFSLLLGTGLGSLFSMRIKENYYRFITAASITVAILSIMYLKYLDTIFQTIGNATVATLLITLPLGFFMGFPFPLSIRSMKEQKMENFIAWMWGVNGIMSLFGSTFTIIIGILFGFSYAVYLGAGLYVLIALFTSVGVRRKQLAAGA
ncbi:MAG: hypothetical protein GXO77_10185 [Calditrichaeota bacterium]|nr:hypothetical protein [Calditrichota bacterium]